MGALASQENCGIRKVFPKPTKAHPRIVGGEGAGIGQFPWIANLVRGTPGLKNYKFSCGGSLIGPRIIITAAHCVLGRDGKTTVEEFIQT
jgi:secreted trypsin-like serine protease